MNPADRERERAALLAEADTATPPAGAGGVEAVAEGYCRTT